MGNIHPKLTATVNKVNKIKTEMYVSENVQPAV